jgi:hypothetical protein
VGWGRASSFGFSALGFERWQEPNVLDQALAFFCMPHNTPSPITIHFT